jgi:hypothetical protein
MLQPAPPFTRENANKMREKGYQTIVQRKNAEIDELKRKLVAALTVCEDDEIRRKGLLREQMSKCDEMMAKTSDPVNFKRWAESKAKLWELLYPKPGSLRPKQQRAERAPVAPLPIEPKPAIVAPAPDQNHNDEIVQS